MIEKLNFTVSLQTNLVLSASPANEGFKKSLDYIPGSKFLGIAAKSLYKPEERSAQEIIDLFHNGIVRFGDAHPLLKGKPSFPIPHCWQRLKDKKLEEGIYLNDHLLIGKAPEKQEEDPQPKQVREGYIALNDGGTYYCKVPQIFSIKSGYDRKNRRSEKGKMFGYFALKKGSTWYFSVEIDDPKYAYDIKKSLLGKKRLGRSSSAEYGQIYIEESKIEPINLKIYPSPQGKAYLYAASKLCFYDTLGNPTLQPAVEAMNLPSDCKTYWKNSFIQSRTYQSWNKKRNRRDSDRFVFEKGSVLEISINQPLEPSRFQGGIGAHRNEGFGQVWLNPPFLFHGNHQWASKLIPVKPDPYTAKQKTETLTTREEQFWDFWKIRKSMKEQKEGVDAWVNSFILGQRKTFNLVGPSQWGQVRNIARNTLDHSVLHELLFDEKHGFLFTGFSKSVWKSKGRAKTLKDFYETLPQEQRVDFMIKLGTEMPKLKENE